MKMFKKVVLLLLTLALLLTMAPAAFADVGKEDIYVLQRALDGSESNLAYVSPYIFEYKYGDIGHDANVSTKSVDMFAMHNTTKDRELIPTYCLDMTVGAEPGVLYHRMNLEDSTYAASVAGRIRAIMLKGFYIENPGQYSDTEHQEAIDKEVADIAAAANNAGFAVTDLTMGEAMSATQLAIWQVIHGESLLVTNFAKSIHSQLPNNSPNEAIKYKFHCNKELVSDEFGSIRWYYSSLTAMPADRAEKIPKNISAIYNYLLSLGPVGPTSVVVSPSSFINLNEPVISDNGDGTYDISITATVDVQMAVGDTLTLKADLQGYTEKETDYISTSLNDSENVITLTIDNVPAEFIDRDVTLSISGYQTGNGVFMFDAAGERESSQTMVAMDNSRLPVYAEVVVQKDRVLKIVKTTESGQPLEGIAFDIYHVATLEEYFNGEVDMDSPESYVPSSGLSEYTVITDKDGFASLNFTQHGLKDGVYVVAEQKHPAIVKPIDPFFVIFPATREDGSTMYEIAVFPKNQVKGSVDVVKDVISLGNDSASVNAGEAHTWIISATVPEDIAQGVSYVISDTLDNRLDYVGNFRAAVETTDGQTVLTALTEGTDYTLTVKDVDSVNGEGNPGDSFTMQLTAAGMEKVAGVATDDCRIRVYFDAKTNGNAEVAEKIPNQSTVSYTNSVNFTFSDQSDKPEVYTGAVNLRKVDAGGQEQVLAGAEFEVYRPATSEEEEGATTIKGVEESVVKVSFYDNAQMTGEKVPLAATDENGQLAIYGLAYGKYYLLETKAPTGYNLMREAQELTIDDQSHLEEKTIIVTNTSGAMLPETGGIGTDVFVFSGALLMVMSLLMLLDRKRRNVN